MNQLTPGQICEAQRKEIATLTAASFQWDAAKKNFDAAAFLGDKD